MKYGIGYFPSCVDFFLPLSPTKLSDLKMGSTTVPFIPGVCGGVGGAHRFSFVCVVYCVWFFLGLVPTVD
jgi:hypothetical protein